MKDFKTNEDIGTTKDIYVISLNNTIQLPTKESKHGDITDIYDLQKAINKSKEIAGSKVYKIIKSFIEIIFINNKPIEKMRNVYVEVYPENKLNDVET